MNHGALALGCLAVTLLAVAPAQAKPISGPGAKRLAQISGLLGQVRINPAWAGGQIPDADFRKAAGHTRQVLQNVNMAVKLWNSLGYWDKKSDEARVVVAELKKKSTYQKTLARSLNAMNAKRRAARAAGGGGSAAGGGSAGGGGGAAGNGAANGPRPAAPGDISSKSKYFIRNFDANFSRLRTNPKFCAGQYGAAQRRAAQNLQMGIQRSLGFAMSAARKVPEADKGVPAVGQRLARLAYLQKCEKAIALRDKQLKAGASVTKARYFAFFKDGSPYSRTMRYVIPMLESPKLRYTPDGNQLKKWMDEMAAVHKLCTTKYIGVENDSRYGHSADRNPEKWCEAAKKRAWITNHLVGNFVAKQTKMLVDMFIKDTGNLASHNGYSRLDSQIQIQAKYDLKAVKKELDSRFAPLFSTAGLTPPANIYKPLEDAVAGFWTEVDKLAPRWTSPKKDGAGLAAKVARKQVKHIKLAGKVVKAYTTRRTWRINKNALGVPLSRSKPGYVMYKSKDRRKWCVSRVFTYSESYKGGGRYTRSNGVSLGYVRYMSCRK